MKCDNHCSNPAEYRIHRVGQKPKNVCSAHKYVETHSTDESMFTIQPLTLEGHIEASGYRWVDGEGWSPSQTGRQWYDSFKEELSKKGKSWRSKLGVVDILDAAKKAAGLE